MMASLGRAALATGQLGGRPSEYHLGKLPAAGAPGLPGAFKPACRARARRAGLAVAGVPRFKSRPRGARP